MNRLILGLALSSAILGSSQSSATMSSKELEEHKSAMKKQGISTIQQLCSYAGKGSMTGGHWNGKTCYFPAMASYNKYRQKFEELKPLLKENKPSFDLHKYLKQTNSKRFQPLKGDVTFAGLGAGSSYNQVMDKVCSHRMFSSIERKPKANFCASPESYIVNNIRFHDVSTEDFLFKGNQTTLLAGNGVDITTKQVTVEGVDFAVKFEFEAPSWRDMDAIKGMLMSGDVPMEFIPEKNYVGKYSLKTIELIPLDRINRKLYQENFSQLVSFFEKKFPGKVSKKIGDLKLKGVDFVELDNQYRKSIKYKFYNKIDLGKYKQLYLNSLKNDKSNSEI